MRGEFATIAEISSLLPGPQDPLETWIGDDAAVLRSGSGWALLAADTVVAGVHADLDLTGLADLGWKAVASAVSDIAAMGGDPGHCVVTVSAPAGTDVMELYAGVAAAAAHLSCPVVGGDLTSAGQLVVSVAVTGRCDERPVLRSGARPGDLIWVTGPLGASAAGLRLLQAGRSGDPAGAEGALTEGVGAEGAGAEGTVTEAIGPELRAALVSAHARPTALLDHGRAARRGGATAMVDVSDGLAADLGHIAQASGVGVRLDSVPVHPGATLAEALGGGEDYALVFCAPGSADLATAFAGLVTPIMVGRCTDDPDERTLAGRPLAATGYEHSI